MSRRDIAVLLVTLICLVPSAFAGDDGETGEFTLEEFLQVPYIHSPVVSPDGTSVAYIWTRRDLDENTRHTQIWLADVESATSRRLSFADSHPGGLAWRPDGSLSFIQTFDDAPQVWINPLDGAEPRPVTDIEDGVGAYWWSPCGKFLAVLAAKGDDADCDDEDDAADAADDAADWTVMDRLENDDDYQQVWIVAAGLDGADDEFEARQLTEAPWNPQHVAWSPDGTTIAVTYNPRFSGLIDEDQRVALINIKNGDIETISDPRRHASMASFSSDGKSLVYFTDRHEELRAYLNLKDLVLRDLKSGDERVLTASTQIALGGSGSTPGSAVIWSDDDTYLSINGADGTALDLYRIAVADGAITPVTHLEGTMNGWSINGGTFAYIESALHLPGSVFARALTDDEPRELASVNDAVVDFDLSPARKLSLPGADGLTLEGYLFLPPGADMDDHLPAIIEMHGGPFFRYGNAWTTRYPWQVLAREGFAVFITNPRGATGYGEDFLHGVYRNFGTDDYRDIMAAVDALVEEGTIDPDRLGFTGYSYGGLMTDVVISRTDRFKAAVSIAGIYNYVSAMGQSNPQLFIDSYRQPWAGDLQLLWEHSPASRADRITTPTLIMHGKDDKPVDPRQSIEMFSYMQLNGVPSRLVLYPGEGHGINKPSHMIDYQTRELEWFRHYLLGDEEAEGADKPVPVEKTVR